MTIHGKLSAYFGMFAAISAVPVTLFMWSLMTSGGWLHVVVWSLTPICAGVVAAILLRWSLPAATINPAPRIGFGLGIAVAFGTLAIVALAVAASSGDPNLGFWIFVAALEFVGWYALLIGILVAWISNILAKRYNPSLHTDAPKSGAPVS